MQSNTKPEGVRRRLSRVTSRSEKKQALKVHVRKILYRVGYSWNKGGRLKELRIRHLARKFLKIWKRNTFGRVFLSEARSHHHNVVVRRVFNAWKDEWWTSRREWTFTMRADCHYRYYLYVKTLQKWQKFVFLQREKNKKVRMIQLFADMRQLRLAWDRWKIFTEMRRMKKRMLRFAVEQKRLSTIHSAWTSWQTRLRRRQDFQALEDRAFKLRALTSQRLVWTQWKKMYAAACCLKENESIAALHFNLKLKKTSFYLWIEYVSWSKAKRKTRGVAHHASCIWLMKNYWNKWRTAMNLKQSEDASLHAAGQLVMQNTQRKVLAHWKTYVNLCRRETERNQIATQHCCHRLLRAGLQGLSSNVTSKRTQRLNKNMAFQHWQQTMKQKHWNLWQDCLEETEDQDFISLAEMAQKKYSISLRRSCLHYWRQRLAEQRHIQDLELRADAWFIKHTLPQCLRSWAEFTRQRRLREHRKNKAEVYNRQRQYSWGFYTWCGKFEKRKKEMLTKRMAILHENRGIMERTWTRWRQCTQQKIQKIAQRQKEKISRLKAIQHNNEIKLLKQSFGAWKKYQLQMSKIYDHVEELHRQQTQCLLRNVLFVWKDKAALLADVRIKEQQAQNHFENSLQLKVLLAWREATTRAVSKHRQQEEAVSRARIFMIQVQRLKFFRQWRKQTKEVRWERMCMEKAKLYHNSKLITKAWKAWNRFCSQQQKKKVLKRQGNFLLRLKTYQTHYEEWKAKLQHRQREAQQTERALWHWSLTLQAKVLFEWRRCVSEERRKREETSRAAQADRDQLPQEGVTRILTYAAHMNPLTTSLREDTQEQTCQRIERAVKRCAMHWKQRVLHKLQKEPEVGVQLPKKTVAFSLPAPESISSSISAEQETLEDVLGTLLVSKRPRRQPRRCKELFESSLFADKILHQCGITSLEATPVPFEFGVSETEQHPTSSCPSVSAPHQSTIQSAKSPPDHHLATLTCSRENHDLLLPPSAFMGTGDQKTLERCSIPGLEDTPFMPFDQFDTSLEHHSSTCPETDSTAVLMRELVNIQQDMKRFQQSRRQLRAWRKLKEVLQSWLETNGKDDEIESSAARQELMDLEERISTRSTELERQKPMMVMHIERLGHLLSVLHT